MHTLEKNAVQHCVKVKWRFKCSKRKKNMNKSIFCVTSLCLQNNTYSLVEWLTMLSPLKLDAVEIRPLWGLNHLLQDSLESSLWLKFYVWDHLNAAEWNSSHSHLKHLNQLSFTKIITRIIVLVCEDGSLGLWLFVLLFNFVFIYTFF